MQPTAPGSMLAVHDAQSGTAADDVGLAQAGDVAAFERLYRANAPRVYALCLRLSTDPMAAEELTQDVFVRAWEKPTSVSGESGLLNEEARALLREIQPPHELRPEIAARLPERRSCW